MRSSRTAKKKNRKIYIRNILLVFLLIIPAAAVLTSAALNMAMYKNRNLYTAAAAFTPEAKAVKAFKYNFDIASKELYRVEIGRFDKYEDAEAQITALKQKKLNGFIVKEQGYVTAFGLFPNKSQADTAAKYLKRKKIDCKVNVVSISAFNLKYDDTDKDLVDLTSAVDAVILSIISQKSALSLECLYSEREIGGTSIDAVVEQEARLAKYLNYLKDAETSDANASYKQSLEELINELLVDRLQTEQSYDYYILQNSLMNQGEALIKFYEKRVV